MWTDPILLALFKRFPPEDSAIIFKAPEQRPEMEYDDEVQHPYGRWFGKTPQELFAGKEVLDLGCGFGGRPVRYAEQGARVAGVEISEGLIEPGKRYAESKGVDLDLRVGTGEDIPFESDRFDLITMYDVMEHVIDVEDVVSECYRVLRPGGRLAVVFPPYYSVTAGSHLHGYATRVPGLNLILPTRALKSAARRHMEAQGYPWREYLREVPSDKLWNMNGCTVRRFKRIVRDSGFEPEMMRYIGQRDRRISPKRGLKKVLLMPAFLFFEMLARIPIVQEAFCIRIVAVLRKP